MRFDRRGKPVALLWVLWLIGTLFLGICFDNVQTDSCLACRDFASGSTNYAASQTISSQQKGVSSQQIYVFESSGQGSSALVPRRVEQRINPRFAGGSAVGALLLIFSFAFFFGQAALFSDGLCAIISNIVILRYIHGQDGEKALS